MKCRCMILTLLLGLSCNHLMICQLPANQEAVKEGKKEIGGEGKGEVSVPAPAPAPTIKPPTPTLPGVVTPGPSKPPTFAMPPGPSKPSTFAMPPGPPMLPRSPRPPRPPTARPVPPVAKPSTVIGAQPPAPPRPPTIKPPMPPQPPKPPMPSPPPRPPVAPAIKPPAKPPARPPKPGRFIAPELVDYGEGIDTLDIESAGNWLLKRVWWEKAQAAYEKVKATLEQVLDARMEFFTKRNSLDKDINKFYTDIGFAQGELDEVLDDLIENIEKEREEQGALDEKERELLDELKEKKNELEQLKLDLQSITDLDVSVDDALMKLMEQINLCRNYEKQAWQKFKAIAQELDDKKAKELAYQIDNPESGLLKDMQAVLQYIQKEFSQYFNSTISKTETQMSTVKRKIDTLKQKGLDLEKTLQTMLEQEEIRERMEMPEEEVITEPAPKPTISWTTKIMEAIKAPVRWVSSLYKRLFSKSKPKVVPAAEEERKEKAVEIKEEELLAQEPIEDKKQAVEPKKELAEPITTSPSPGKETVEPPAVEPSAEKVLPEKRPITREERMRLRQERRRR